MICSIVFYKHSRELGRTHWDQGFEAAKQHALSHAKINNADLVEIRDESGGLLFQHPPAMQSSKGQ